MFQCVGLDEMRPAPEYGHQVGALTGACDICHAFLTFDVFCARGVAMPLDIFAGFHEVRRRSLCDQRISRASHVKLTIAVSVRCLVLYPALVVWVML